MAREAGLLRHGDKGGRRGEANHNAGASRHKLELQFSSYIPHLP